ncbi:OLC1v1036257C1 [Oldenlandia corymbosa var. corymbosa]|uniref:Mitochondrial import inner membrane translocase subunit TIM50 n=1 Tax=Oldenlandia corymbosa var. corymbosa TaxID=529605 RepID=A0AAV1CUV2_OLDCO|nr:OLC1v1036257C1 [Oldenlandia corymbosa var. corymbosa]
MYHLSYNGKVQLHIDENVSRDMKILYQTRVKSSYRKFVRAPAPRGNGRKDYFKIWRQKLGNDVFDQRMQINDQKWIRVDDEDVMENNVSGFKSHRDVHGMNNWEKLDLMPANLARDVEKQFQKKLLILDLNGILVHVVHKESVLGLNLHTKCDYVMMHSYVFKRKYSDEFLEFCFERFHVAIWSSRKWDNLDSILQNLFPSARDRFICRYSQEQCHKVNQVFCKDLTRIWVDLRAMKFGEFDESNTLLVDDSVEKSVRNLVAKENENQKLNALKWSLTNLC